MKNISYYYYQLSVSVATANKEFYTSMILIKKATYGRHFSKDEGL